MNFNQILIRLGVDATAVTTGLGKTSAYVKGWGTKLAADMRGSLFRMFAAGFVADKLVEGLGEIKGKILEIHRAQEDLGGGNITNFIQGMFNLSERMGLSYEGLATPLIKFKKTLDTAKLDPQGLQAQNLVRYGVITNVADLKTQDFVKSLGKLSDAYVKSGKNLKILSDMGIRMGGNFPAFQNIMSMGGKAIEDMNKDSFFTKLTPQSIEQFSAFYSGAKKAGQVSAATFGNMFAETISHMGITLIGRAIGQALGGSLTSKNLSLNEKIKNVFEGIKDEQEASDEKLAASLQMEQQKVAINERLKTLLFEQSQLQSEIADQNKESVSAMADMARKALGIQSPLQLANHTVTPIMRQALKIDTLEEKAMVATRRGNTPLAERLQGEADQLRASNPNLRRADRNPMEKTEFKLNQIYEELQPISATADFVNKNSQ